MQSRLVSMVVLVALATAMMPVATANPLVPYCAGSVAGTYETRIVQPEVCESVTGRVFPEAMDAADYVSFFEFEAGLAYLESQYPDKINIIEVADSYGQINSITQARDSFPVYIVEVTNEASPVPMDDRLQLLFMLSIHGNEKGGREGGLRVLEDLAAGRGMALETVQNGAGMPAALAKPTGGDVATYGDYLDFTKIVLLFPNPDGWAHDEAEYAGGPCPGYLPTLFCRTNGNGTDLNRQVPTIGWHHINAGNGRLPVNEPEAVGYIPFLKQNYRFNYAIDIHGMLNHENFVAVMMPAGSMTPQEMLRSTRLAEELKQRLNADEHFSAWTDVLGAANDQVAANDDAARAAILAADETACPVYQQLTGCLGNLPDERVASGEFADWGTVWDAIGYTDSGFSGDFFAQSSGLNAPGYDIELAYNHITVDSQYEGVGAQMNDYHVHSMRHIVKSFMDAAALDVKVSIETHGTKTAYIRPSFVATNLDDEQPGPGGWAGKNPHDDLWEYGASQAYAASPERFWLDLKPFLRNGNLPGVLDAVSPSRVTGDLLARYDSVVIPGSAIADMDAAHVAALDAWVRAGGQLVLTDQAVQFLDLAGITSDAVDITLQYAGAVNMDRDHELTAGVRGYARQTYEPVPLGFSVASNSAPAWFVDAAAFDALGGDAAGWTVQGQAGSANMDQVSLGRAAVGEGQIAFLGALLPDPSEEFYHPYGIDHYATTYSGNQILRNILGWEEVFTAPPVIVTDAGEVVQSENEGAIETPPADADASESTPFAGLALVILALLAVVIRRR